MKKLLGIVVLGLLWFNMSVALPTCVGEDSSKWTMCEGTKAFNNNLTYTGEWKDENIMAKELCCYLMGQNI